MSDVIANEPMTIAYGEITIDVATMPTKSLLAMVKRGVAHYLGNEQAAKVTSWKESFQTENKREATDDEIAAKKAEFTASALEALNKGEVGHSTRGPRGTALETVMRAIALERATTLLGNAKLKMPSKDEKVTFPNGQAFTRQELIDRQIAFEKSSKPVAMFGGKTVREAAEAKMKEIERAKARAAADPGGIEGLY